MFCAWRRAGDSNPQACRRRFSRPLDYQIILALRAAAWNSSTALRLCQIGGLIWGLDIFVGFHIQPCCRGRVLYPPAGGRKGLPYNGGLMICPPALSDEGIPFAMSNLQNPLSCRTPGGLGDSR